MPPAEQLRQQLAEITQKLQEITSIPHHSHYNINEGHRIHGVRRSVTATTPMVNRKPPPAPSHYYSATISTRRSYYPMLSPPLSRKSVGHCFEPMDSDDILLSNKSNHGNEEPLLQNVCKETPQHNMSLMKCYVESKIDAQIQKHAYARQRSKSCIDPNAEDKKNPKHDPMVLDLPQISLPKRESGILSSI
ncbi:hypothetical protein BDA99DRAFT_295250 [Phascolomyces articulosus]|uniref:Uncharacterized protein n=1 Tax=Phascolomyces articulosus TaxID=60185 RepID=A0AAD5JW01_9FUNG|nr:hypothetical protein BDA99DRAFT_295250 [Phascolomyces articulosus]